MEIVLLEDLAVDARQWLAARHQVDFRPELQHDPLALRRRLYKTEALVVPPSLRITSELLDFAPKLVVIGRIYEGADNIDFEACQRRRVRVVQASTATARATAEFMLGSLLSLFRPRAYASANGASVPPMRPGREINDSVIGLFGLSPPAQMLAPMLLAMGARVVGYEPALHRSSELWSRLGVQPLAINDMLQTADAVAMQIVYVSRYHGLVGERLLSACKPGQLWACASRASIFDLQALAQTLRSGRIAALNLDSDDPVLANPENPLQGLPNLQITARVAPRTQESWLRGSWFLADRLHETLQTITRNDAWGGGVVSAPIRQE